MRLGKRIFDFFFSLIGLVFLSPLFILIGILIKFDSSGPIFFRQERIGLNGKKFRMYKFRTMAGDAEKKGMQITVGKDSRINRIGHYLRKFNLDELPQLINVLKGEMSIVGPRPEVPNYVELYTKEQKRVLSVKPGMTDYASLDFRKEDDLLGRTSDPEDFYIKEVLPKKLKLNLRYMEDQSFWLDMKLIFRTIGRIIAGK